jgi:hypothetical protein
MTLQMTSNNKTSRNSASLLKALIVEIPFKISEKKLKIGLLLMLSNIIKFII